MKTFTQHTFLFSFLPFLALSAPAAQPCTTITGPKCPVGQICVPNPGIHCTPNHPCPGTCARNQALPVSDGEPQPPPAGAGKVTFNPFSITKREASGSESIAEAPNDVLEARKIVFNPFSIDAVDDSDSKEEAELKRGKNQSMEKREAQWSDIEVQDGAEELDRRGNTKWDDVELVDDADGGLQKRVKWADIELNEITVPALDAKGKET